MIAMPTGAFLALAVLLAAPSASAKTPTIGVLAWSGCGNETSWFLPGFLDLGYRAGETVMIECRSAGGRYAGFPSAAAQLVAAGVDVIVGMSQPAGMAARAATDSIPIVSILSGDPVAVGMAQSLAHPGGNLTGVSYYATDLTGKRLELLKEMVPNLSTVDVLANPVVSYLPFEEDAKREAGRVGMAVRIRHASEPADLDKAFAEMTADGAQAVFVLPDMVFAAEAAHIADLALKHGLPSMAWGQWYSALGCLMAYSARYDVMNRRLAYYVDRILKGANPADLPIEQPTTFVLSINLRTAKALGLEVPQALLLRADEVIE
jgi:putative ABC transport system substrate-binding protein